MTDRSRYFERLNAVLLELADSALKPRRAALRAEVLALGDGPPDPVVAQKADGRRAPWDDARHERHGQAVRAAAAGRKAAAVFYVLEGGETREVTGWPALCEATGLLESSLRVKFSAGRGVFFHARGRRACLVAKDRSLLTDDGYAAAYRERNGCYPEPGTLPSENFGRRG